jgi:hypothetical protein
MVTWLTPAAQVATDPLATEVDPFRIATVAPSAVDVAVMTSVALVVWAVYSVWSAAKTGLSVSAPIVSVVRRATKGLL